LFVACCAFIIFFLLSKLGDDEKNDGTTLLPKKPHFSVPYDILVVSKTNHINTKQPNKTNNHTQQ
jgi:hypothetical protein